MNLEMFRQSGAGTRKPLMKQDGVLMDKSEWNEFGEAAGLVLDISQQAQLIDPVRGGLDVAVHQSRSAADPAGVRGTNNFSPLRRGELVARKDLADFVVEDFGGGAGQRAEAVIAQHGQIVAQYHSSEFYTVNNFHGREGMNVHAGNGSLHRPQDIAVIKRRQAAGKAALDTNFGGPQIPRLYGLFSNLLRIEKVRIGFARAATESAEFAPHKTNIREIDIAIDHVGDEIAHQLTSQ